MESAGHGPASLAADADIGSLTLGEAVAALRERAALLVTCTVVAAALGFGLTFLVAPTFTASTTFMPPQQAQSGTASALASLGSLAGLAAGAVGIRSSADQYVSLMQSVTVSNRLIERFKLMDVYDSRFKADARKTLGNNVRISAGKKDGLINVEVDDTSPQRAADMANRYVDELRLITAGLAVTEAQQRRMFFEQQLQQVRDRLVKAQQELQASGFNSGALRAEPKAAAEVYARLKAEVTSAEVRLQITRAALTDSAPEVRSQQVALAALREQLSRTELASEPTVGVDYVSRYRDFKYQETLFEIYARQFELARIDESREGALIQVVDAATPPERKSKPKRTMIAAGASLVTLFVLCGFFVVQRSLQVSVGKPRASTH